MGLFTQKPQFDDELPGLPGEPLRPESAAERLPDAAPVDIGLVGLLGEHSDTVESIVVPVVPVIDIAEMPDADGDA